MQLMVSILSMVSNPADLGYLEAKGSLGGWFRSTVDGFGGRVPPRKT